MSDNTSIFGANKGLFIIIGAFVLLIVLYIFAPQVKFSCDRSKNVCSLTKSLPVIPIEVNKKYYKLDSIKSVDCRFRTTRRHDKNNRAEAFLADSVMTINVDGSDKEIFSSLVNQQKEYTKIEEEIEAYLKSSANSLEVSNPGNTVALIVLIIFAAGAAVEFYRHLQEQGAV